MNERTKNFIPFCVLLITFAYGHAEAFSKFMENPFTNFDKRIDERTKNFQVGVEYWRERIQKVGADEAFKELSEQIGQLPLPEQHKASHRFGTALYKERGVEGFALCGEEFGQGCRHTLFGEAMYEQGPSVLSAIKKVCGTIGHPTKRRSCEHGLGHGLIGYYGYDLAGLEGALATCSQGVENAHNSDFVLGCAGGIFMEYNTRGLLRDVGISMREVTDESVYHPCDQISSEWRPACAFWQPVWWYQVDDPSPENAFHTSSLYGYRCKKFMDMTLSAACFKGIGYIVPNFVSFDSTATEQACVAVSDRADNRLACWVFARVQLFDPTVPSKVLCHGLQEAELDTCEDRKNDFTDYKSNVDMFST